MLLLEIKKEEKSTGSTPPSYKSESKTTGEWKVTEKKEFKDKGPAVFKKETKNPPQTVVSTTKEEYKGQEQGVYKNTKDDKGNKVVFLDTGKRHFEYNSVTTHTVNFPQTTVIANGGEPATFIYEKKVVAPVKESKAVYMSGAGPTFTQKWTATGKGARCVVGLSRGRELIDMNIKAEHVVRSSHVCRVSQLNELMSLPKAALSFVSLVPQQQEMQH